MLVLVLDWHINPEFCDYVPNIKWDVLIFWKLEFVEHTFIIFQSLHVNVELLINAKELFILLKLVTGAKLDCAFTIDAFINETRNELKFPTNFTYDLLYKLHCDIVYVFTNETRDELKILANVTCDVLYKSHLANIEEFIII